MKQIVFLLYALSFSVSIFAQAGCTDPQANNYDESAQQNDGSCLYDQTELIPQFRTTLHNDLEEISGMINYNQRLFGLADSGNPTNLYEFDSITGIVIQSKELKGTENEDWESITTDENYVYVGDTGNNNNGNREDLVIYRFPKTDLDEAGDIPISHIDRLYFHYEDQTDFTELDKNTTRFDCEAICAIGDSIYLFTKDWKNFNTRLYTISKAPGNHTAQLRDSLEVVGLVTDVSAVGDTIVELLGRSLTGDSFLEILWDFPQYDLLGGNKRQISVVHSSLGQPESLTLNPDLSGMIGTEAFEFGAIDKKQAIVSYSIKDYLPNMPVSVPQLMLENPKLDIFPNPNQSGTLSFQLPKGINYKTTRVIWLDAQGRQLDHRPIKLSSSDTFGRYTMPRITQTGQYFLVLQAGHQKYVGAVQVVE